MTALRDRLFMIALLWMDSAYWRTWLGNLVSWKAVQTALSTWGALWLIVQTIRFFFDQTVLPNVAHDSFLVFFAVAATATVIRCKPCVSVAHKLNGRDVTIEIAIGNIFTFPGAIVVGTNTTFDTRISKALIDKRSIQGQFTTRHYQDEGQLDAEIAAGLSGLSSESLPGQRAGKSNKYPIGTAVRVNPPNRTAYLTAIANLNEHGTASGTFEDLKDALARLWAFISSRGTKEAIVIPVIGTGFCRLTQTREEIVHEIIQSFVAACTERTFADRLTIVVSPNDVTAHGISLDKLGAYLRHVCNYTCFTRGDRPPTGTAA